MIFASAPVKHPDISRSPGLLLRHGYGIAALLLALTLPSHAQAAAPNQASDTRLQGSVLDRSGHPVPGALVELQPSRGSNELRTTSDAAGAYTFPSVAPDTYRLTAIKADLHSRATDIKIPAAGNEQKIDLVLDSAPSNSAPAMQFSDTPSFSIAGVTDWTAIGGHGSDSILRTSESLTRDTLSLRPGQPAVASHVSSGSEQKLLAALAKSPGGFAANHQLGDFYLHTGRYRDAVPLLESAARLNPADAANAYDLGVACERLGDLNKARTHVAEALTHTDSADLHRLAGEIAEKSSDPLTAVREFEQAARKDPSEQNYFEWGSELLLHRAIWQAEEVLQKGAEAWPQSARLRTALGTALFAGARYGDAARRLCEASDLNPTDPQPYIFMGKVEIASPDPLPCIAPKLQRFLSLQPDSSQANYLYAMMLLKQQQQSPDPQLQQRAEALLRKAVALDARNADAWMQLGNLSAGRNQYAQAIPLYRKAIAADAELAEAHYRLAIAYDRTGDAALARQEFQLHDRIQKEQAEAVEQQRREIKQFLVVQPAHARTGQPPSH